ncbi:hypothetical protein D9M68_310850 [compost metagenome]
MTEQTGKLRAGAALEHPHLCDQCGKARNRGNHQACAKKRQEMHREGTSQRADATISTEDDARHQSERKRATAQSEAFQRGN